MNETQLIPTYPGTSPKLKSLQDLSIKTKAKVTKETIDHVGLWVDGGMKLPHRVLESSNSLHYSLSLVSPITNIPGVIPLRVPCRDGGPCSTVKPRRTMRVVGTALLVLWVSTPYLVFHWVCWGWACRVVVSCCAGSMQARCHVCGVPE
jgi:hypothetical protein